MIAPPPPPPPPLVTAGLAQELAAAVDELRRVTVQVRTRGAATGAGVLWDGGGSECRGLVITNAHVVRGDRATVELSDGTAARARVAARHRLLRRPTRRCYGETRRRQHDDAREPGAGSTRGGSRGVGTTRSRAGGTVIRVLIVAPRSRRRRQLEHVVAQDPGLLLVAVSDAFESLNDVIDECRPDV